MLNEVKYPTTRFYKNGSDNPTVQFFLDALYNSNKLDLLLGFFTTSAINILSYGFASFLQRGGVMRVVLNQRVLPDDIEAMSKAEQVDLIENYIDLNNLQKLQNTLSKPTRHFFECIAWLIAKDRIQFQFIKLKTGNGLPHYKDGIFSDGENKIGFSGSCNFTGGGLMSNLERVQVFLDWEDEKSKIQIQELQNDFDSFFNKESDLVDYLDPNLIKQSVLTNFADKELIDLINQEKELLSSLEEDDNFKKIISDAIEKLDFFSKIPKFPYSDGAREYQKIAYRNWVDNNHQGFFAMATGTGKTITSLNCILEDYKVNKFYKFIVLVPTISLAEQWEDEIVNNFNFENFINCNSRNPTWEEEIRDIGRSIKLKKPINYAILTTYATFRSNKFNVLFNDFFLTEMPQMTIIADEAHSFGSESLIKVMPHKITKRIGLSATPDRQFDDIGVNAISDFFKSKSPNYTFSYNMKKAIDDQILCKYYYYPKFVELDQDEVNEYAIISKKLLQYFDFENGRYRDNDFVNQLLIKRKNIIHKARNKSNCLIKIVDEIGKDNFNNAFIYVPEGSEANYENIDIDQFDSEDEILIQKFTKILYNQYGFKLRTFTGETKDRQEILYQFKNGQLNALLAMKCLDEGVDIPQTKYAIFCSSTGNPRQYIQRRGRVLRRFKDKEYAYMYDMVVKSNLDPTNSDPNMIKIEKSIIKSELIRLINFAVLSENKIECLASIEQYSSSLGIDIYDLANKEENKYIN
jgi:superfamily II DNA or RNA helicase